MERDAGYRVTPDHGGTGWSRLEAHGPSLSEAFRQAALGFFSELTDLTTVRPEREVEIFCESADLDLLFSDWINTLIYEIRETGMLFSRFEIDVEGIHVKGKIYGEPLDSARHPIRRSRAVGIAFTDLGTFEEEGGFRVQGVMDDYPRHHVELKSVDLKAGSRG